MNFLKKYKELSIAPILVALFIIITTVLTTYYFSLIEKVNQKHMVYYHAVLNTKFEIIKAHLLIEHSLTTNKEISIENINSHLDASVKYINAMLHGGSFKNTLYTKVENIEFHEDLLQLKTTITKFRNDSFNSFNKGETLLLKLFANQQHNENINRILGLTKKLELILDIIMKDEMSKLKTLQILINLSLLIFGLTIIFIIFKYEKKKSENYLNIKIINKTLEESEEKYRTIIESSHIGICIINNNSKIIQVNQNITNITGYSEAELLSLDPLTLFDENSQKIVYNYYKRRQAGEKMEQGYEVDVKCKDSTFKNVEIYSAVINDKDGDKITVTQWLDVTERKETTKKIKQLSQRLITANEEERSNISRDLHDDIGQELTALKLTLLTLNEEEFEQQKSIIQECIVKTERINNKIRNISRILRPTILDDIGLVPAIRSMLNQTLVAQNIQIDFHEEIRDIKFSKETEIACFRIVQEAITNILRYAQTKTVNLKLFMDSEKLHIIIEDKGIGFDVQKAKKNRTSGNSLGLFNMENRALLIDGTFEIKSAIGKGSQINVVLPY